MNNCLLFYFDLKEQAYNLVNFFYILAKGLYFLTAIMHRYRNAFQGYP